MRNIRLDSLPTARSIASRDCALCTRRRIRCDRSTPSCVKCTSRNFVCPGFNVVDLKWDQGVASRGKFAGSQIPVHQNPLPLSTEPVRRPRTQGSWDHTCRPLQMPSSNPDPLLKYCPGSLEEYHGALAYASCDALLVHQYSRSVLLDQLLGHFSVAVVPRLTWIQLPGNLWPTSLQTLAHESSCLHLSLSCVAAAHLSATRPSSMSQRLPFDGLHNRLRELSLLSINERLVRVTKTKFGEPEEQSVRTWLIEALASMVALCYSEVFVSTPDRWKMHLHGCQMVVERLSLYSTQGPYQLVETFLIKEVADLEALNDFSACSITASSKITTDSFLTRSNSFWAFTGLIGEINNAERLRRHTQNDQRVPAVDMSIWHARADESFGSIISNISDIFGLQEDLQCLEGIVRAHYYATIVYSYQALNPEGIDALTTISEALIATLKGVCLVNSDDLRAFCHNLFFPLLIAGTLPSADKALQLTIDRFFSTALSISGTWCNYTSLQFLRNYWGRSYTDAHMSWIQYARNLTPQGGAFMIF